MVMMTQNVIDCRIAKEAYEHVLNAINNQEDNYEDAKGIHEGS